MLGQTISHYKILAKLGAGGMGIVYKAEDTKLKRFVALKFLPPELSRDDEAKERFVHEAQAASALDHPNICTIYEIGETEDEQIFIAMAYYEGETLAKKVTSNQLSVSSVVEIATQMAQGLAKAHEKGIVHRDIKPANVFVTTDGLVKILDFGLAKLAGRTKLTKSGSTMGTAAYMSPEQIQLIDADHRTDIWSLGVVMYEMLTGKLPFEGEYEQAVMYAIVNMEAEPITASRKDIPTNLEKMVEKCLSKESAGRYSNISELLVDLKQPESSEYSPSVKPKRKAVAPAGKNFKKTSRLKWALAVLALGLIGVVLLYFINPLSKKTTPPLKEIPLTTLPGREFGPAFSPDGNMIAFLWDGENKRSSGLQEGNIDIYVKLIGTDSQLRLTTHPGYDFSPAWSPDGRYLAFGRRDSDLQGAIMIVSALGGSERKLCEVNWDLIAVQSNLAWSPDGEWLAFPERDSLGRPCNIFLFSFRTLEKRKLTSPPLEHFGDKFCAFSPDGKQLAVIRYVRVIIGDIYLVSITGGEPKRLTHDNKGIAGLAWTPDGHEIVFSSNRDGDARLWRISISGGEPEPLSVTGEYPTIPRKTRKLAYEVNSSDSDIWRIDIADSQNQNVNPVKLAPSSRGQVQAQISPDGSTIVFASGRSGKFELWKCDSVGHNPIQLTSFGGLNGGTPRWSPDSRYVAFDNRLEGHSDIFFISVAGGSPQRLTTEASDDFVPSWSRDGRWIYFTSNRSGEFQIWKQPVAGGKAVQVTTRGAYAAFESFDRQWVYYIKRGGLRGIWRTPVAGGDESLVLDGEMYWGQWALAENGIYYGKKTEPRNTIDFFNFATGKVKTVAVLPGWPQYVSVSPDERWLVFNRWEIEGDIFLAENFR